MSRDSKRNGAGSWRAFPTSSSLGVQKTPVVISFANGKEHWLNTDLRTWHGLVSGGFESGNIAFENSFLKPYFGICYLRSEAPSPDIYATVWHKCVSRPLTCVLLISTVVTPGTEPGSDPCSQRHHSNVRVGGRKVKG